MEQQQKGRPKLTEQGCKQVCVSLPKDLIPLFRELGGSVWLRQTLKAEAKKKQVQ